MGCGCAGSTPRADQPRRQEASRGEPRPSLVANQDGMVFNGPSRRKTSEQNRPKK